VHADPTLCNLTAISYREDNVIPHYNGADKNIFDDYIVMMVCFFSLFLDISVMRYITIYVT